MHSHGQLLWHLLSAMAVAASVANAQTPVTRSYCTTSFDTKSTSPVKTKTDYSTKTEKPTIYVTSTPSIVTTPPPSTATLLVATITTTTVTASQITDTFTDISTVLNTITVEAPTSASIIVTTETSYTTIVSGTSTVPAPAGFTPIQISVGKNPPAKRDLAPSYPNNGGLIARANARRDSKDGDMRAKPSAMWPKKVECSVQVTAYAPAKTSVKTAKTTTTVAAPAKTYTVTETTTIEATFVFLPTPASTTVSTLTIVDVPETTTPSTTITNTETITNTVVVALATEYAQCGPDNFFGGNVIQTGPGFEQNFVSGPTNAYECCVACAQRPACEISGWYASFNLCNLGSNVQQTCEDTFPFRSGRSFIGSNGCANAKPF